MIYTSDFLPITEAVDQLGKAIIHTEIAKRYCQSKKQMQLNQQVLQKKATFLAARYKFEKIADYGSYAPEYQKYRQDLWKKKRILDMEPVVSEYRLAETDFQGLLDEVCQNLANTVSNTIKVDTGNPLIFKESKSCNGGCH